MMRATFEIPQRAIIAFALALTLAAPAAAQDRARGAPQTDQTVDVSRGSQFQLDGFAGAVDVRGWDKDAVRVQAWHAADVKVAVRKLRSSAVTVEETSGHGQPAVEYAIDVPRWMPVTIDIVSDDITIEGVQAEVSAETVRGNVAVRGGAGPVHAETVEGRVLVDGARGRVEVSSVNNEIRVSDVTGEVSAETTNGAITLARISSSNVEVETLNGNVAYDGSIENDGHYSFTTHNGDILLALPEHAGMTLEVRTYNGSFKSDLPLSGTQPTKKGARGIYKLGNGGAAVEVETFGGSIRLQARTGGK
jgi:DUF4097 and DUF4098 domain-containing protein YvlB